MAAKPVPFKIQVSDDELKWINDRVATARIPPGKKLPDDTLWESWGLPPNYAQKLHKHWTTKFDWRKVEREINKELAQYTVPIAHNDEDLTIHFVHHRSERPDAIPLLFLHGWPGTFLEVRRIIGHLTDPPSTKDPAYHVIAPSLPGFAFSAYPSGPCSPIDMAEINHKLMIALGYEQYMVQGGDWGSVIGRLIAALHPKSCRILHINMVIMGSVPSPIWNPIVFGRLVFFMLTGLGLNEFESKMFKRMKRWLDDESSYMDIQGRKSQTLSYGLTDSPFGMMCWLREKMHYLIDQDHFEWEDDEVITWAMPYVLNGTPGHAEIYRWAKAQGQTSAMAKYEKPISAEVAFGASIFPKDCLYIPRWCAEVKVARNIVYWNEHEIGGHFPAIERPAVLVSDIREFTKKVGEKVLEEIRKASKLG